MAQRMSEAVRTPISTIANPPSTRANIHSMNRLSQRQHRLTTLGPLYRVLCLVGLVLASQDAMGDPGQAGSPQQNPQRSGVAYRNDKIPDKPLSIHIVKAERNRPDLVLATTLAKGTVLDLSTLSEQIRGITKTNQRPQVGINGDFYRTEQEAYAGDPLGFQVMDGELVSSAVTNKPCFWTDALSIPHISVVQSLFKATLPDGRQIPFEINEERLRGTARLYTPRIGSSTQTGNGRELILERDGSKEWLPIKPGETYSARVREIRETGSSRVPPETVVLSFDPRLPSGLPTLKVGDLIQLSTATLPETRGCQLAIGGGPTLIRNGVVAAYKGSNDRHPRSAFGWNDTHWFFVEVDGRQSQLSVGMSLPEFAEYLRSQGIDEAINLDGGGSATLWFLGQVVNSPCYGRERNTANGLILLKKDTLRREPD